VRAKRALKKKRFFLIWVCEKGSGEVSLMEWGVGRVGDSHNKSRRGIEVGLIQSTKMLSRFQKQGTQKTREMEKEKEKKKTKSGLEKEWGHLPFLPF
jgi:hypothetical protein